MPNEDWGWKGCPFTGGGRKGKSMTLRLAKKILSKGRKWARKRGPNGETVRSGEWLRAGARMGKYWANTVVERASALKDERRRVMEELSAAIECARRLREDSAMLQSELRSIIGPVPAPDVKPGCWCCSCVHQSAKHEGCKMCHIRDDVQAWLDNTDSGMDHGTGFLCPKPDRDRCPGWEPR